MMRSLGVRRVSGIIAVMRSSAAMYWFAWSEFHTNTGIYGAR